MYSKYKVSAFPLYGRKILYKKNPPDENKCKVQATEKQVFVKLW